MKLTNLMMIGVLGAGLLIDGGRSLVAQVPANDSPQRATNWRELGLKPVETISLDLGATPGPLPNDLARPIFAMAHEEPGGFGHIRLWPVTEYAWEASAVAYKPLLFEDEMLERYGHHYGVLQPAASAANFFGRLPVVPYMHGAQPYRESYYALGHARPGDDVPHFFSRPRWSWRGALYEGAAATGLIFLIP